MVATGEEQTEKYAFNLLNKIINQMQGIHLLWEAAVCCVLVIICSLCIWHMIPFLTSMSLDFNEPTIIANNYIHVNKVVPQQPLKLLGSRKWPEDSI